MTSAGRAPTMVGARYLGVADEVAVGELGALRVAGRAGGVEDHRGVLVVTLHDLVIRGDRGQQIGEAAPVHDDGFRLGLFGAAAGLVRERMPGEHQPGPGVAQIIGDLPRLEQRVHRDDHAAGAEHPVVHHGDLGDVRPHDPHPVARFETAFVQQPGDLGARLVQGPVGHRGVVHPHGHPSGVGPGRVRQILGQVRHGFIVRPAAQAVVGPRYQACPRALVRRHNRCASGPRNRAHPRVASTLSASPPRLSVMDKPPVRQAGAFQIGFSVAHLRYFADLTRTYAIERTGPLLRVPPGCPQDRLHRRSPT